MTETRLNEGFVPYQSHRAMTSEDAAVFHDAAVRYAHPELSKAILSAGGDKAHLAHFSREICSGAPALGWAFRNDAETVLAALKKVEEDLAK